MTEAQGSAQFGYEDHFTPARTRKKRKNRPQAAPPSPTVLLNKASEELAQGDWLRDAQQTLRESLEEAFAPSDAAPDVLCLGLGSPASSRDARAQLAFLLAACDDLSIDRTRVSVYDPVFADEDLQLLAQFRLTHLPENRRASYGLATPTVVFMPHCDLKLYENLLRANWSQENLPNVLLIANRLSEYAENIPSRTLASEHPCVARLAPYLTSRPLRPCAAYPTAFNNTSVQYVRSATLAQRDADWWTLPGGSPSSPASSMGAPVPAAPATERASALPPSVSHTQRGNGEGAGTPLDPSSPLAPVPVRAQALLGTETNAETEGDGAHASEALDVLQPSASSQAQGGNTGNAAP
ncbi:SRR1-domain-containing protein [Trametes sanguinea]|nr:SRR1-domain-containing protein [Trametes sanguinea]